MITVRQKRKTVCLRNNLILSHRQSKRLSDERKQNVTFPMAAKQTPYKERREKPTEKISGGA